MTMAIPEARSPGVYEQNSSSEEPSTPITTRSVESSVSASLRSPSLDCLASHGSMFSLDEFARARSHSSKPLGKLLSFARSPKPARPASSSSSGHAVGGGVLVGSGSGSGAGAPLTADALLTFQDSQIPTSLLRLPSEDASRAVKSFGILLHAMGVGKQHEPSSPAELAALLARFVSQGLKRPALRDELYLQLIKQTRGCPDARARAHAWQAALVVAHTFPPTAEFVGLASEHVRAAADDPRETQEIRDLARRTWTGLKRVARAGARRVAPDAREVAATLAGRESTVVVHLLDGSFEDVHFDAATTVADAVAAVARQTGLEHYQTFGLFAQPRERGSSSSAASSNAGSPARAGGIPPSGGSFSAGAGAAAAAAAASAPERALDDARYLADVLALDGAPRAPAAAAAAATGSAGLTPRHPDKAARAYPPPRLVFRKRLFRETDEDVSEPRFVQLSFTQALADHVAGAYPVSREDAAELAALAAVASGADPGEGASDRDLDAVLARFSSASGAAAALPRAEARADVGARLAALRRSGASREEAALGFLRIVRGLPYGGAAFYPATRIEDPIGLLPARLLLAVNRRGVHFFRPVPREYLHSAELRDIMQFGSSSTAVFFKMRVAGVLHVFQFETPAGEDICLALQTHINDVMARRYARADAAAAAAAAAAGGGRGGAGAGGAGSAPAATPFGPQYAAHVKDLQSALDAARADLEARDARLAELDAERADLSEELEALRAGAAAVEETPEGDLQTRLREAEGARELAERRLAKLEAESSAADAEGGAGAPGAGDAASAAAAAPSPRLAEAEAQLQAARAELKAKESKVNELVEALGDRELLLAAARDELEGLSGAKQELTELRELRDDVERRERAQAEVVAAQAKRLEELDRLYREEVVARKRAHNAIEDLKGKIRVYCRVRPLLDFERERGQVVAVDVPDALSVAFTFADRKREYSYDQVFDGASTQEQVFGEVKHLVQSALDGYNVCIFAYGQTGSGKTHTIYGDAAAPGITPRATRELFDLIDASAGRFAVAVKLSMLELYCDDLSDLLADRAEGGAAGPGGAGATPPGAQHRARARGLEIKKNPQGVVTVPGAALVDVRSADEALAAVEAGMARRHVGETKMNRASSRSHLIISFVVEATNLQTQNVTRSKLSFVDLAGSERVKKSGSEGAQLKEAQAINKSLSALGNVISALASEQSHVPYRDHKLTMLMSDSVGGTAKTLMFVNVSPVDGNLDETNNSLQYATRVSAIRNDVTKNEANKEVLRLQKQVAYWKAQAGIPAEQRDYVDLVDIADQRQNGDA